MEGCRRVIKKGRVEKKGGGGILEIQGGTGKGKLRQFDQDRKQNKGEVFFRDSYVCASVRVACL